MKLRVRSDFWDYYDHHFDIDADIPVFKRFTTDGPDRPGMFRLLEAAGLRTPRHGKVRDLKPEIMELFDHDPNLKEKAGRLLCAVVVYHDVRAHRGDGKELLPYLDALERYPDAYASEHIPATPGGTGLTYRYLQVGDYSFWIEYTSRNDWHSNCGEVSVRLLGRGKRGFHPRLAYPLFAVDFVVAGLQMYAIDFNIAPQVRGTGVEEVLPAAEAAAAIKRAFFAYQGVQPDWGRRAPADEDGGTHEHAERHC